MRPYTFLQPAIGTRYGIIDDDAPETCLACAHMFGACVCGIIYLLVGVFSRLAAFIRAGRFNGSLLRPVVRA